MKNKGLALKLTESAVMIALATVLSLFAIVKLPYGGSVTLASMLPVLLIAYRHGTVWGLFTGLVHGVIQLLLDTGTLSYVTGAASVAAVIILDYLGAFSVIGLGGLTRRIKSQRAALCLGAVIACTARFVCHTVVGCTIWKGLSIPTGNSLLYSVAYNISYMLPELIVLLIVAYFVTSALDFSTPHLTAAKTPAGGSPLPTLVSVAPVFAALIYDVVAVFGKLQSENDSGAYFDITNITTVNWMPVAIVSAAGIVISAVIMIIVRKTGKSSI